MAKPRKPDAERLRDRRAYLFDELAKLADEYWELAKAKGERGWGTRALRLQSCFARDFSEVAERLSEK